MLVASAIVRQGHIYRFLARFMAIEPLVFYLVLGAWLTGFLHSCRADSLAEQNPEAALLRREIECFHEKDFAKTAMVGKLLLDSYPGNAEARYYLATALLRLGKREDALKEYSQAYSTARERKLRSYCQIAINNLSGPADLLKRTVDSTEVNDPISGQPPRLKPFTTSGRSSSSSSYSEGTASSAAVPSSPQSSPVVVDNSATNLNSSRSAPNLTQDLLQRKANILEEGENANKRLRDKAKEDIRQIKQGVADQLSQIPAQLPGRLTFRTAGMIANPEFSEASTRLNAEANQKIDEINRNLQKRIDETTAFYQKQAAAYDETAPNLKTQMKPGTSLIQLTPQNTNPYLRNFMNYDGSVPGALKAKAGALPSNASPPADYRHSER
jgi:tetratricopeptide (TPR) repeat protein